MKPFINISFCCCIFLFCLTAQAQEKAGNSEEVIEAKASLIQEYNAIIGGYWEKPVKGLPGDTRDAILIAIAKKTILRKDKADYFGLQEIPEIEYVKITHDRNMPRSEKLYGKMAYRITFYKTPDKKEFKHIVYIMEDTGQIWVLTNFNTIISR